MDRVRDSSVGAAIGRGNPLDEPEVELGSSCQHMKIVGSTTRVQKTYVGLSTINVDDIVSRWWRLSLHNILQGWPFEINLDRGAINEPLNKTAVDVRECSVDARLQVLARERALPVRDNASLVIAACWESSRSGRGWVTIRGTSVLEDRLSITSKTLSIGTITSTQGTATITGTNTEPVVANIRFGLDDDVVALPDSENDIFHFNGVNRDEISRDDGELVAIKRDVQIVVDADIGKT